MLLGHDQALLGHDSGHYRLVRTHGYPPLLISGNVAVIVNHQIGDVECPLLYQFHGLS